MDQDLLSLAGSPPMAALLALEPLSYALRLCFAGVAFGAAMNAEKTVARVIGFVWLLLTGAGLVLVAIRHETVLDAVLGLAALGAAGYSWWYTRT